MNEFEYKLKVASEFEKENKFLHALQIYLQLLDNEPYERTAVVKLSEIYEKLDRKEASVSILKKYILKNPEDLSIRKYASQLMVSNGYYQDALEMLSFISDNEYPELSFLLGIIHYNLNELRIAEINFNGFIERNRVSEYLPDAYLYLAKTQMELNKPDAALNAAKESEKLSVNNYELHQIFAKIYFIKEMYFHAGESVKKAIELNKKGASLYELAGEIMYKTGDFKKAEYYLKSFIKLSVPKSDTYSLLGHICLNSKQLKAAKEYFDKALILNPLNKVASEGLQQCSLDL